MAMILNSPFYNRKYIYIFIQMSLVSVAGDGRDVFFWGGENCKFLGLEVYCMVFCIPLFWDYTVGWKNVSHPRQDLDVQAYIKMSQNMTSFGQFPRYQFQRSKALYSIQYIHVKCDWLSALTTHWVAWSREKNGFTSQRNLCYGHKLDNPFLS